MKDNKTLHVGRPNISGGNQRNNEWFFSNDVAQVTILKEWDDSCEKICAGILNLPRDRFQGDRKSIDESGQKP
jgi:hypothetical protein